MKIMSLLKGNLIQQGKKVAYIHATDDCVMYCSEVLVYDLGEVEKVIAIPDTIYAGNIGKYHLYVRIASLRKVKADSSFDIIGKVADNVISLIDMEMFSRIHSAFKASDIEVPARKRATQSILGNCVMSDNVDKKEVINHTDKEDKLAGEINSPTDVIKKSDSELKSDIESKADTEGANKASTKEEIVKTLETEIKGIDNRDNLENKDDVDKLLDLINSSDEKVVNGTQLKHRKDNGKRRVWTQELCEEFLQDVKTLSTTEVSNKWGMTKGTVYNQTAVCKRKLGR